jgi:hypothetical protein
MKVVVLTLLIAHLYGLPRPATFHSLPSEVVQMKEKESRTKAEQKIDSQLLLAIEQQRGRRSDTPIEEVKLRRDSKNRVLVDVRVPVTKKILAALKNHGAKVISTSARDHSIIAYIALNKIESVAELKEVKFIMPAAEATTN